MRLTEARFRRRIRQILAEEADSWKLLGIDAMLSDLTDPGTPLGSVLSGKAYEEVVEGVWEELQDLDDADIEKEFPEFDLSAVKGDRDAGVEHIKDVVTKMHAKERVESEIGAAREDLMYFGTKSKMPELKALQKRVLDPNEPEYTIDSVEYQEDLHRILDPMTKQIEELPPEEAKRLAKLFDLAPPRSAPKHDFKTDPDAETVPGIKEEGKKRKKRRKKKRKSQKMPAGYKAKKGTARGTRLRQLTKRYRDALKTPGKADDMAAIKARDAYEKTQKKSNRKSKYTEGEVMSEDVLRQLIQEIALDEKKKRKKSKKKRKSRKISSKVNDALKNKAKKHNAPLGALKAVYRKGMGAFYTSGSRPGQNPHSWSMARVNSFLKGGKARQVDATQWKQVQKHRARKRKKK